MKVSVLGVVMACLPFIHASIGLSQQQKPESERPYLMRTETPQLYFSVPPTQSTGRVELAASDAQVAFIGEANLTSAKIDSILQLRGNVQVRMCLPSRYGCEKGSIVLRADAVDYNEKTREIDAHGDVRIIPDTSTSH
jgi:lipopolysaccharide assembly outer membrane protein LptD (OstA)